MLKRIINIVSTIFVSAAVFAIFSSYAVAGISKCKDENGKWHYGDNVSYLCSKTKVTTLNERGVKVKELAAPKTEDELAAEKTVQDEAAQLREQERALQEQRNRILGIYETEADIERARKNNITSLQQQVVVHDAYIKSMGQKRNATLKRAERVKSEAGKKRVLAAVAGIDKEVEKSGKAKTELNYKIEEVNQRYDGELALFRKHKSPKK